MTTLNLTGHTPGLPISGARTTLRTLILDDSEVDRARLRRYCNEADLNLDVVEAATIADFAEAIKNDVFQVFLIDYRLVQGDGLIAIEMLRRHPAQRGAASVMIAGEGHIQIAVDAMKAGCNDYILKDRLTSDVLRRVIEKAIVRQKGVVSSEDPDAAQLESAMRKFAENTGAEMRSVLSSMTRRLRALRGVVQRHGETGAEFVALEEQCDRLWTYLGEYRGAFLRQKSGGQALH